MDLKTKEQLEYRTKLRQLLIRHFDLEEFRDLCFDLGVDSEALGGEGGEAKVRELVAYMERHGRSSQLHAAIQVRRPYAWAMMIDELQMQQRSVFATSDNEFSMTTQTAATGRLLRFLHLDWLTRTVDQTFASVRWYVREWVIEVLASVMVVGLAILMGIGLSSPRFSAVPTGFRSLALLAVLLPILLATGLALEKWRERLQQRIFARLRQVESKFFRDLERDMPRLLGSRVEGPREQSSTKSVA